MTRRRARSKTTAAWSEDDQAFWDKVFLEALDPDIEDPEERLLDAEEFADMAMFLRQAKHAGDRPFTCGPDDVPEVEEEKE